MKDHAGLPTSHRRRLNIVGIDLNGDVWTFGTADPFRADAVLQQMKKSYTRVVLVEGGDPSEAGS
jgi:hypothetical protein